MKIFTFARVAAVQTLVRSIVMNHRASGIRSLVLLALVVGLMTPGLVRSQSVTVESDGQVFTVTGLELTYGRETLYGHPSLPPLDEVLDELLIELSDFPSGYARFQEGTPTKIFALGDIANLPSNQFHASAIEVMNEAIVAKYNDMGVYGMFVAPDPEEIVPVGLYEFADRRPKGKTTLGIVVWVSMVDEMRTVAVGDRIKIEEARVNNSVHDRIVSHSPVAQFTEGDEVRKDVVFKQELDDYLYRLNRHPARRVDMAISAAEEPGGLAVDYMVAESKPWFAYFEIQNTGTENTDDWRETFGFVNYQTTNNDDVLSVEYVTTAFDEVNSVSGNYEAPFFDSEVLRWNVGGSYTDYTASDVGLSGQTFDGNETSFGGQLYLNIYQENELFVDLFAGIYHRNIQTTNIIENSVLSSGDQDFILPQVGIRLENPTETSVTYLTVNYEWNEPSWAGTESGSINGGATDNGVWTLGRTFADSRWDVIRWDMYHSFYLEPLFNRGAWEDVSTPESSTLAHEIVFRSRGQWSDDRLIPQGMTTVGGLYTVRGYRESLSSGDSVVMASAEYVYHVPRAFAIEPDPSKTPMFGKPFRRGPQQVYGRPDWDLMCRAFVDYAETFQNDIKSFEDENTLLGIGLGVELLFKQNLSLRCDWGVAMKDTTRNNVDDVTEGSQIIHLSATLLY